MGYIYKITSPTNRIYIGQAKNLRKRIATHKFSMRKEKSNVILINSFKKHGFKEHKIEIIEECENEVMNEREIFWIKKLNSFYTDSPLGMNMTTGGEGHTGFDKFDEERKKKVLKNLYKNGENPFKGRRHTDEVKKYLSELTSKHNKETGKRVPQWGSEKGWAAVMKQNVAYGRDGKKIGEYKSLTEAAKLLGLKISNVKDSVLRGSWIKGQYKFLYKTDNNPEIIPTDDIRFKEENKPVIALNKEMFLVGEYNKPEDASKHLNIPVTTIRRAAAYNNLRPIRKGYIFAYKEDYHYSLTSEMEVGEKPLILKPKKTKKWQDQKAELH